MRGTLLHFVLLAVLLAAAPAGTCAPKPADTVFDHPADAARLAKDLAPALAALKGALTVRGRYQQQKRLHEVPRPLKAEGSFLFMKGTGISWHTEQPFDSELVITGTDLFQRENGATTMHVSADQQPGVRIVAEVFFAVFALDFDALGKRFDLYSRPTGNHHWELGLRPKPGQGGTLKEITVGGGKDVDTVKLAETNGDLTELHLKGKASAAPATADEQARFKP